MFELAVGRRPGLPVLGPARWINLNECCRWWFWVDGFCNQQTPGSQTKNETARAFGRI